MAIDFITSTRDENGEDILLSIFRLEPGDVQALDHLGNPWWFNPVTDRWERRGHPSNN